MLLKSIAVWTLIAAFCGAVYTALYYAVGVMTGWYQPW